MTAPNIEMIAASLRNCSLGRGNRGAAASLSPRTPPPPPPPRLVDEAAVEEEEEEEAEGAGLTVELNSELPLPYHWEQCLDIRTGEIYYVNWENGTRTTEDPRTTTTAYLTSYYSEEEEEEEDTSDEDSTSGDGGDGEDDSGEPSFSSSAYSGLSSISSPSPGETATSTADPSGGGEILVAAGCKACFMYFMVPKRVEDCPKCGGLLLHLGRNGCI
ncbi:uncharacterized protein LOC103718315 [Phoenix dactylifera]|uniref:Uncharacterized protein LOC103718315 n=1 Tax=Phoenix dactylifera TaxID=42345 RepID=A0A8B9AKT8_PHODC|nr:uncharacterized protein LOC103718315 [Phoenix dactylifera]